LEFKKKQLTEKVIKGNYYLFREKEKTDTFLKSIFLDFAGGGFDNLRRKERKGRGW